MTNKRTCRSCGETLKQGYYHKHAPTTLECATAGCGDCRTTVKSAHLFRPYGAPPIRLHEAVDHTAAYRAARRENEVA